MKAILRLLIATALAGLSLSLVAGCEDDPVRHHSSAFEAHEWGVMFGCASATDFTITARPPAMDLPVREPVIYIHGREGEILSAAVNFQNGQPTLTFPPAYVEGDLVWWDSVTIVDEEILSKQKLDSTLVPLEFIIPILNNVDADPLLYGTIAPRFLFYEGQVNFAPTVTIAFADSTATATIANVGPYTVYDIIAVRPYAWNQGDSPLAAFIDSLLPGQQTVRALTIGQVVPLENLLTDLGFTSREAAAFRNIWQLSTYGFTEPNPGGHLMYRLPQAVYDNMFTLTIDPPPDEVIRALYVLIYLTRAT